MTLRRVRAALVGAGRVGAGYSEDRVMARYFPFATHAQVLAAHPALAWEYVVDRSADVRERVQAKWGVRKALADVADLRSEAPVDLVVVATPPTGRLALIESLSGVKAVLLEKPMAVNAAFNVVVIKP